jgi:hypothetical protein
MILKLKGQQLMQGRQERQIEGKEREFKNASRRNKCRKCGQRLLKNQFLSVELYIIKLDLHIIIIYPT